MFGKYNGFVSKANLWQGEGFCMHVFSSLIHYYYNVLHPLYLGVESHVMPGGRAFSRLSNEKKGKALGTRLGKNGKMWVGPYFLAEHFQEHK
jgi:hypothetical protein